MSDAFDQADLNHAQAIKLLENIAMMASCLGQQILYFESEEHCSGTEERACLMSQNLAQVGWMADLAGSGQQMMDGAEAWFLSPEFQPKLEIS